MKVTNLTIDNYFRNPLRWGKCPVNVYNYWAFGVYYSRGENMPASFTKRWVFVIYFHKWFKAWSNYPLN